MPTNLYSKFRLCWAKNNFRNSIINLAHWLRKQYLTQRNIKWFTLTQDHSGIYYCDFSCGTCTAMFLACRVKHLPLCSTWIFPDLHKVQFLMVSHIYLIECCLMPHTGIRNIQYRIQTKCWKHLAGQAVSVERRTEFTFPIRNDEWSPTWDVISVSVSTAATWSAEYFYHFHYHSLFQASSLGRILDFHSLELGFPQFSQLLAIRPFYPQCGGTQLDFPAAHYFVTGFFYKFYGFQLFSHYKINKEYQVSKVQ